MGETTMGETLWPYVTSSSWTSANTINWSVAGQPVPTEVPAKKKLDDMRWLDQRVQEVVNKSGIAA